MRKLIYSALAAIGLLLSPSCSDENEIVNGSGNEALVSFTVNLADGIQTKAISDGKTAKTLFVKVFDKDGNLVPGISGNTYTFDENKNATVNLDLVKGKSYKFLFWAQYTSTETGWSSPYTINDDGSISISYENADSNKEERDAFLATEPLMQVTGSFTKRVELHRPFAQLNFLTTADDIKGAVTGNILPGGGEDLETKVTLSKAATKLNPFTNTVSGETQVVFNAYAVPFTITGNATTGYNVSAAAGNTVRINDNKQTTTDGTGTEYYFLATNYFLVAAGDNTENSGKTQALVDATLKIDRAEGDGLTVTNVPAKWNYRTNIYGDLLTASNKFNVIIAPGYEDVDNNGSDDINSSVPSEVATPEAVAEAITNSSRNIIYTANIAASELVEITIPKVFNEIDDKDLALTFTGSIDNTANIAIKAAEEGNGSAPKNVTIKTSNGKWTVELTESTVTFTGGTVQSITSSTAPTTLIIAADMVVTQSINALAGGIKVLGTVGTNSESQSSGPVITIASTNGTGNIEIQGTVNGNIQADNNNATVTIQQGASVTGNVEAKNDIVVHGSVTGNLTITGNDDASIQIGSEATVTGNLEAGTKEIAPGATAPNIDEYTIRTADDLFAFAKQVNEKRNTYSGKTVVLANDIDLAGRAWTPIGGVVSYPSVTFAGTFDGNDKTISNLTASDFTSNYAAAGFFGSITGKVQNLTLQNVNIRSSHYAGGIVGYSSNEGTSVIENCHVKSGTITSTPERSGSSYDNGDKVGGIIGHMVSGDVVKDCSVSNVTIQGYRDLGGIAGFAGNGETVTQCTVSGLTLIQDYTNAYKTEAQRTVGAIIGRNGSDPLDRDFTSTKKVVGTIGDDTQLGLALSSEFADEIDITLACDVNLNASDAYLKLGGSNTSSITISGQNSAILNLETTYWSRLNTKKEDATLYLKNLTVTSSQENGTWNSYDMTFMCNVDIDNVTFQKAVALDNAGKTSVLKNVTINENNDYYALWIVAGGDVTLKGRNVINSQGRAIAIKDEYVTDPQLTKLTVSGTTFKSQKKAAVLVTSTAGANIVWGEGNDISGVQADQTNAVWNDSDRTAAWNLVTVDGCTKYQEQ